MGSSYRDLLVWKRACNFSVQLYRATADFPKSELYGLVNQLRRASVSVASNIAEGQGRLTRGEFAQFLGHARGSLLEVQTQLMIATELGFLSNECHRALHQDAEEILYLLNRLLTSVRSRTASAGSS